MAAIPTTELDSRFSDPERPRPVEGDSDVLKNAELFWVTAVRENDSGGPNVYAVAPSKALSFGEQPFTHTSHRFDDDRENHQRDSSA